MSRCVTDMKEKAYNHPLATLRFSHLSRKSKKVSLQPLPTEDAPPQPSTKPYYMSVKWLLCFSPPVDVKDPSRSSSKVHLRDWSMVDVLIQRCPWLREMSCLKPLHETYITEYGATDWNQQMEGHYLDHRLL